MESTYRFCPGVFGLTGRPENLHRLRHILAAAPDLDDTAAGDDADVQCVLNLPQIAVKLAENVFCLPRGQFHF